VFLSCAPTNRIGGLAMKQKFKEGDFLLRVYEESLGNRLWTAACKQVGIDPFTPVRVREISAYGHPIFHSVHPIYRWLSSKFVAYVPEKSLDEYM
jgi:hypothetical protein